MDTVLTKDAEKLLCLIYKDYLEKRKGGLPKSSARTYSERSDLPLSVLDHFSSKDAWDTIRELKRTGFVRGYSYSGFMLTDQAIIYMENRFPNGIKQVLEWLGKIKGVIPFV